MGETRVDIVHLLEDLRDAYPGSIEETILTEIVANTLDSGARTLRFSIDRATSTLVAVEAHPAYRRAKATRSEAYHLALTVASALAPLAVEAERQQDFVNRFLASWGEAAFARRRSQ